MKRALARTLHALALLLTGALIGVGAVGWLWWSVKRTHADAVLVSMARALRVYR